MESTWEVRVRHIHYREHLRLRWATLVRVDKVGHCSMLSRRILDKEIVCGVAGPDLLRVAGCPKPGSCVMPMYAIVDLIAMALYALILTVSSRTASPCNLG